MSEYDDHVNAMIIGLYYIYEQLGLKGILIPQKSLESDVSQNITKDELRKFKKEKEDIKKAQQMKVDNEKYFQKFIY